MFPLGPLCVSPLSDDNLHCAAYYVSLMIMKLDVTWALDQELDHGRCSRTFDHWLCMLASGVDVWCAGGCTGCRSWWRRGGGRWRRRPSPTTCCPPPGAPPPPPPPPRQQFPSVLPRPCCLKRQHYLSLMPDSASAVCTRTSKQGLSHSCLLDEETEECGTLPSRFLHIPSAKVFVFSGGAPVYSGNALSSRSLLPTSKAFHSFKVYQR